MALVASIATYDKRVAFIRSSVESIVVQTGIDRALVMTGTPEVKEQAQSICNGLPVEVVLVEEIGPGKKHLVTQFCSPNDMVITFDDDRIYPEGHAQFLANALLENECPMGLVGFQATVPLRPVRKGICDFLHGEYSWVYRAGWVDPTQIITYGNKPSCFANDDVYLGWIFAKQNRQCLVLNDPNQEHQKLVKVNTEARAVAALRSSLESFRRMENVMRETFWTERPITVGKYRS